MCGIAGVLAPVGERAARETVARMVATLRHRGPDAEGVAVDGRCALGATRLRVIDLTTGDPPVTSEDGAVRVVLNGEIYNFRQLRARLEALGHRFATAGDTEVIAHAYEQWGAEAIERLDGMFAFALWDGRRQRLLLARDRMGEKPLYWARRNGWLLFASELRALRLHPLLRPEIDPQGVCRYLAFDYVPDPHTILRGVEQLPPGHWLLAGNGFVTVRRYWDVSFAPERDVEAATWEQGIAEHLDAAVGSRLVSDVPVGCLLSGGIDSTAVAATAVRLRPGLRTFSVGYEDSPHDERAYARLAAQWLGTRHQEVVVSGADAREVVERLGTLLDEPFADTSFVPLFLLCRAARESVTVALTGDGGDELFGGYASMAAFWWQERMARVPRPLRRALDGLAARAGETGRPLSQFLDALGHPPEVRNQPLLGGLPPPAHLALLSPAARAEAGAFDAYTDIVETMSWCASKDPGERLIYQYCKLFLAGQNLVNTDRASMAVALELRAPFLDHRFVDFVGRIPARMRLGGFRSNKWLLRAAVADRLPPEILHRRKQPFRTPCATWLRGPLADVVEDTLAPDRLRSAGFFDPDAVGRLLGEHRRGERDREDILWSLLVFELWRRETFARPDNALAPAAAVGQ